jgi:DNA photolyase
MARTVGATALFVGADSSGYAQARERRLTDACERERFELRILDTSTVVPPGFLTPDNSDHYRVSRPTGGAGTRSPRRRLHELRYAYDCHPPSRPGNFRRFVS